MHALLSQALECKDHTMSLKQLNHTLQRITWYNCSGMSTTVLIADNVLAFSLAGPDDFRLLENVWSQPQYLGE